MSPSSVAKHQAEHQDPQEPRILCNRPAGLLSIPVTLLHPIFGQFMDNCRDHVPTPQDNEFVRVLSSRMSDFFVTETARRDAFIDIMSQYYHLQLSPAAVPGTDYKTDGHATANGEVYMISEAKNELGTSGDPVYQTALCYLEFMRLRHNEDSVLPCLHIYYAGE
jgi:hypothetical protein